jgi:hypothetical protein
VSQLVFPFTPPLPPASSRRRTPAWRVELRQLARIVADQHHRHEMAAREADQRLTTALDDIRARITEVERGVGMADLRMPQKIRARQ